MPSGSPGRPTSGRSPRAQGKADETLPPLLTRVAFVPGLDAATRRGCRIWGHAEVLDSGERFDGMNQGLAAGNLQAKFLVFVSVDDFAVF